MASRLERIEAFVVPTSLFIYSETVKLEGFKFKASSISI